MYEDYCTDCGERLPIKAFAKCEECLNAWFEAAAARHGKGLQ